MKSETLIRSEGMRCLRQSLGLVAAEKFIALIQREPFDYTEWQRDLWADRTLSEVFAAARDLEESSG